MRVYEETAENSRETPVKLDRNVLEVKIGCRAPARTVASLRRVTGWGYPAEMYELALTCDNLTEKEYWLREAAYENYLPAMFELALMSTDVFRRRVWLRRAAENGHLVAMHRLGQESQIPAEKRRWLHMAAEEGYVPAMYDLAMLSDSVREGAGGLARPLEMAFRRPSWSWRTAGTERQIPATDVSSHVIRGKAVATRAPHCSGRLLDVDMETNR